ncbi:hypothetical protein Tcan_14986, partial [Toxocara canis]
RLLAICRVNNRESNPDLPAYVAEALPLNYCPPELVGLLLCNSIMMLIALIVFAMITAISSACNSKETFPNATALNFHHYSCTHELRNGSFVISSMTISNDSEYHYPFDMGRLFSLTMTINNTGIEVHNVLLDIEVFVWERLENGQCAWEKFPTFGFTEDLDGCETMECPLRVGYHENFTMNVDMRGSASFLDSGKLYQMKMIVKNGDRPKGVRLADFVPPLLGCTVIQAALL